MRQALAIASGRLPLHTAFCKWPMTKIRGENCCAAQGRLLRGHGAFNATTSAVARLSHLLLVYRVQQLLGILIAGLSMRACS
jgi:hypothetical protein